MLEVMLTVRTEDVENKVLPYNGVPKSVPFKIYMCLPLNHVRLGQVVGECICDKVNGFVSKNVALAYDGVDDILTSVNGKMCLCHIRDVEWYNEPMNLDKFIKKSDERPFYLYAKIGRPRLCNT